MSTEKIRITMAQMEVIPGHPARNTEKMIRMIKTASREKSDIIVFPELAIPGYLVGDEWEYEAFLRECEACANEIRLAARKIVAVFGSVGVDWSRRNEDGRARKYNALFTACEGRFIGPENGPYPFVVKTLAPNYREFDESRHFFDLRKLAIERNTSLNRLLAPVKAGRLRLGAVLCEDAWDTDYGMSPLQILAGHRADIFINASSSPYTFNKNSKRNRVFLEKTARLRRPLVYVNNVGIQDNGKTVFTFDGASCAYDAHGNGVSAGKPFEETTLTVDVPTARSAKFGAPVRIREDSIADIYAALTYGTARFMARCGASRVVIGISGGIDSAVVASLYSRILKPDQILAVNMPGPFTSMTTRKLAQQLASNLKCLYTEVPIIDGVELTKRQLGKVSVASRDGKIRCDLALSGFMLENVQARDRSARILAALASAFGAVFTCNANKSEATVGYGTFYGDLAGYFANIADLWKTEVYELARYVNSLEKAPLIPQGIMDVTPSAELSAAQNVDEKKGDPIIYAYHDCLFRSWIENWNRTTPEEILGWYSDGSLADKIGYSGNLSTLFHSPAAFVADIERWWDLYQGMAVAKRLQAPPVLAVKRRAFGFDHRESQMGPRYTSEYARLKARLLKAAGRKA